MKEPSVLDFIKSRLNPWQKEKIHIPAAAIGASEPNILIPENASQGESQSASSSGRELNPASNGDLFKLFPWRTLIALFLALVAQKMLEPPSPSIPMALGLYVISLVFLVWANFRQEFVLPGRESVPEAVDPQTFRTRSLTFSIFLALLAFLLFSNNLFTALNVTIWLLAILMFLHGLWLGGSWKTVLMKGFSFLRQENWNLKISRQALLLIAIILIILFFRFYNLSGVPGEPFSDHAEKLLDVFDITQGQTHIFFPRNTGREFIQFYLTALIAGWLGTGLSFLSLKIGTALIGLFTLPFIYLLGKEIGGKRVAVFALFLAGTSYWLNTISRIGLRFPLYPAFTAPALYFLIRGLRRQTRNDFILSGLFLGLGLNGYSPYRIVPFVLVLAAGLFLLHKQSSGKRKQTLILFAILVLASIFLFLPLGRYALENPQMFSYRALTRLTGEEQAFTAPVWKIFLDNSFNAMLLFNYNDGEIWVHSIPHRPALDVISAVLFLFGFIFLLVRYFQKRDWLDLFLLLSIPMLLLPSTLSLAFPNENPSLNRTGGAAVIVFIIAAMALDAIYTSLIRQKRRIWQISALVLVGGMLTISANQSYDLVFHQFSDEFMNGAWNTSDIGNVIHAFVEEGNNPDNAFVVPYPYWVDTRLVGIQAGYPTKDYALWSKDLSQTLAVSGNKLFIFKEEDQETMDILKKLYPSGMLGHFNASLPGKNFWIFTVSENLPPAS